MVIDIIKEYAEKYALDRYMLIALVGTESNFNPLAMRYEPDYRYLYKVEEMAKKVGCTLTTMYNMQKFSMGLTQIMAANYYAMGGTNWASVLFDPEVNIKFCCEHLKKIIKAQGLDGPRDIYAGYNGGSLRYMKNGDLVNKANVERFMGIYDRVVKI